MFILNICIGFLLFFIVLTSSGVGILSKLLPSKKGIESLVIGTILSSTLLASLVFFIGKFTGQIQLWIGLAFFIVGLFSLVKTYSSLKEAFASIKRNKILSIFSLFASASLASTVTFSWITVPKGLFFQNGVMHDSVWHIALIKQLLQGFPVEHPSSYEYVVKEYHYLFDVLIAAISKLGSSPEVLFYQVFPISLAILLALSSLLFIKKITRNNTVSKFVMIFSLFFVGNLGYILPFFNPGLVWSESSFWVSQTFNVMINPQLIYSFIVLFVVFGLLFDDYYTGLSNPRKYSRHLVIALLIASSIGFKSYLFPLLAILYGIYLLVLFFQKKFYSLWLLGLFLVISLPFILSFVNLGSSTFIYAPLWFSRSMFEAADRINYPRAILIEQHLIEKNHLLKLAILKMIQVAIFYVGNLGTRTLLFIIPFLLFIKSFRKWFSFPIAYLVGLGFIVSSIIPLLFIQKGVVWNSIQFWYYTLIFANIMVAILFGYLWEVFGKKHKAISFLLICIFISISIPSYFRTMHIKLSNPKIIPESSVSEINEISDAKMIAICKEDGEYFYQTSFVSALTGASVYFADPDQLAIVDVDVDPYKLRLKRVFADKDPNELKSLIATEKIDYIVCDDKNWYNTYVGLRCVDPRINTNNKELYSVKVIPYCPIDSSIYLK